MTITAISSNSNTVDRCQANQSTSQNVGAVLTEGIQQQQLPWKQTSGNTSGKKQQNCNELQAKNSYWIRTGKQLMAGALSGWVEASITYPTEYVKVMLQLDDTGGAQKRFRSSFDVIQQTVRTHGIFGVYRGFSVVFCGNVPKYIFRFGSFEQFKPFLADANGQLSPTNKLICGLGAGVCEALFAVIPMDSVKIKFINDRVSPQPKYRGLVDGIRSLIREKGIGATYQGVTPTLLKQGSNQMIRFFVFESLKEWYDGPGGPNANGQHSSKLVYPVFGAIAGAASVFGNTPLDVVKTRMQGLGSDQFSSTWDCVQKMYRNEGLRSFYKGLGPRLTKVSMEVAIAFTMYNTFLDLFAKL